MELSEEDRRTWRTELYSHVGRLGFTNAEIGEAIGCTGANVSHMIRRGARVSKFLPELDRWLIANIEPLLGFPAPEVLLDEIISDLHGSIAQLRTHSNQRLEQTLTTLQDTLARIQNKLLRARHRYEGTS